MSRTPSPVRARHIRRRPSDDDYFNIQVRGGRSPTGMTVREYGDDDVPADGTLLTVGEVSEIKLLYAEKLRNSFGEYTKRWVEAPPLVKDSEEEALRVKRARSKRASYAILQRRELDKEECEWKTTTIQINSPWLKKALEPVFENYPDVHPKAPDLFLHPPYVGFCHRWEKFLQAVDQEENAKTKEHLTLLKHTMAAELEQPFEKIEKINSSGFVDFNDLKLLFIPGEIVISRYGDSFQAAVLRYTYIGSDMNRDDFGLNVSVVDWNGTNCGIRDLHWYIEHFKDPKKITTLDVYPLRCHPAPEALQAALIERGKKWESLRGLHHMYYTGTVTPGDVSGQEASRYYGGDKNISERVILDAAGPLRHGNRGIIDLQPLSQLEEATPQDNRRRRSRDPDEVDVRVYRDNYHRYDRDDRSPAPRRRRNRQEKEDLTPLSDKQRLVAVPTLHGFALHSKDWCQFDVVNLKEIQWKQDVLQQLVLDENEKSLILGLLSLSSSSEQDVLDDVVEGKGKGIVMLLCGPPGVGKTLTAETVSEHLHQPLYRLDVGDLGSYARGLEENLTWILERCARWKAVILLDEADVYLETRSTDNLARNELVSVFIRVLEYYQGVIILTSNRATAIDPAFESRIDITLAYKELTEDARVQVWRNFLQKLDTECSIGEEDIVRLAAAPLNGRQIKSAIKTARILATGKQKPLDIEDLEVVIGLRKQAMKLIGSSYDSRSKSTERD
ncbi:P-loop containing nucleoside triphosphate hydrolase protein [Thozetella sp. PMI_491]|nr:P-loop containing nucleoside triphosphate hydrolase protein [Thozetella sp. PMI_491]